MPLRLICFFLLSCSLIGAKQSDSKGVVYSTRAEADVSVNTDPASPFWRNTHSVIAAVDSQGWLEPEYRTEMRSRWTRNNIYFLFICPYKHLYLNPKPDVVHETNELWKWNVAEVFIGSNFQNIKQYKEFEISPQGEWVDLDINLDNPRHEEGWVWNSGFEHAARIDESKHIPPRGCHRVVSRHRTTHGGHKLDTNRFTLFDQLMTIRPSPVVALNRAIAIAQLEGPERGLEEIHAIADHDRLASYPFYSVALGELELRSGRYEIARQNFQKAFDLARNAMEKRFLERRMAACECGTT